MRVPTIEEQTPVVRVPHLDNLRTLLVAWVIGGHALLGYSAVGGWAYDEVNEVTYVTATELVLVAILGSSGLFVIGLFFFISGLLTEQALARHGRRQYVRDRVLRLGLPWLASALLVWPASVWLAYTAAGRRVSFWWVLSHRDPLLDSGSLWFALVLLVYSVAFVLWHRLVGDRHRSRRQPLTGAHLAVVVVVIAATSFVVRLWFPARSGQIGDLHLWQWPQCLGMFALGVVAARHGWARHIPDRLRRGCGAATLATLVLLPVLALASGLRNVADDAGPYLGGWHWQALATPTVEAILVVTGSVWLVGFAERRVAGGGQRATGWTRGAFVAFVIQGPVLMALASAARLLDAPAEIKAPLVAAVGIPLCFWLGRHLKRVPGPAGRPARPDRPVHHVDYGGTTDGPTIVLVHGLGGSHLNWDLLAPMLTAHGRVLALDLPGFGMSEPTGRPATIRSNVDVLAGFIREVCQPPVVLVGNSMGGLISILLTARMPALVRGLVLLDPALPAPARILRSPAATLRLGTYALPGIGERLRRDRRRRIGARATVRETLRLCGIDQDALPAELVERSVALVEQRYDVSGMDRAFLSASRSLAWTLVRTRAYRAVRSSISAPVLLVHGDRDQLVPVTAARETARHHPTWRYIELRGVGHLPQLQVPDQLATHLLAWLGGLPEPEDPDTPTQSLATPGRY